MFCLHRFLLFDHFSSLSSLPQDIHLCFPLSPDTLSTRHSRTHHKSYLYSEMDILEMNDHYTIMRRSELDSYKPDPLRKDRSLLIESLTHKSTTATLFPPPPLSLDTSIVPPTASSLSLSPTLSSTSCSLASPLPYHKHPVPCYVSCFSPLDLPSEIFVYFLQFLSPADLWRLCQVSHGMHSAIAGYMSKIQRFKYGVVRILHQENLDTVSTSKSRGRTLYEHATLAASSSSLTTQLRSKDSAQVQDRSSYWMTQARFLVAGIVEGSIYDHNAQAKGACTQLSRESSTRRLETVSPSSSAASSSVDLLHDHEEGHSSDLPSGVSTMPSRPQATWSTDTLVASSPHSSSWSLSSPNGSQMSLAAVQKLPTDQLPLDRFGAIAELVFDPNIVNLNHRRAIINCARYVSASIDQNYLRTVNTQDPSNPVFHAQFHARHYVNTGPYLTVFSPIPGEADGLELLPRERSPAESIRSTTIAPPRRLHNYFQVMLWQRCLSDLISLYNRIQSRHVDETSKVQGREVRTDAAATTSADVYPFCCKAHSLVFTTQYPFSIVPYSFRVHLRRMARKVQSVSNKNVWSNAFGDHRERGSSRRRIQYTGPTNKLRFCDGTNTSHGQGSAPTSPTSPRQCSMDDDDGEEAVIQRRYRIEEQIRQDNLLKQELLALCHMACGLFLVDDRATNPPPTLMSLLRQGSPWNKGVWREGEWQHTPIEVVRQRSHSRSHSSSQETAWSAAGAMNMGDHGSSKSDIKDMGRWQKMCIAAIQFMAHEDLAWGGNRTNAELSRLRASTNATSWTYHE